MKKILMLSAIWGLIWSFGSSVYSQGDKNYQAWIIVESQDSYLRIKAYCLNNTSEGVLLKHQLIVKKTGRSGKTRSVQRGSVYLQSQGKKCLAQLRLKVSKDDRYQIELKVYKGRDLVAEILKKV